MSNCIAGLFGEALSLPANQSDCCYVGILFPKQSYNAIWYNTDSITRTTSMRPIRSHDQKDIVNPLTYQNRLFHFPSIPGNRHMWTNQRCCYTQRLSRSCESHPGIRQHLRIHHNLLRHVVWAQHEMGTKIGYVVKQIVCWGSFTRLFRHLIAKRKTWCVVGWRDLKLKV